jgi:hypothetical protein
MTMEGKGPIYGTMEILFLVNTQIFSSGSSYNYQQVILSSVVVSKDGDVQDETDPYHKQLSTQSIFVTTPEHTKQN